MDEIIAFCGVKCSECPAYLAYVNDDDELRAKTAKEWSKMFDVKLKPEDINCVGCLEIDGPQIGNCSRCEIRRCSMERNLTNCAHCREYSCEKLNKFFEVYSTPRDTLDEIRASLQSS